ncbi:MAG: hypothetical protein EOP11_02880 [Proteobacteria bacterium]|nr:MAG: hypothetical protein EOP11_02880 [Pseudomonadota bacterium]
MLLHLLLTLSSPFAASAANMCPSLPKILSSLQECDDNVAFSRAAESCAAGFRRRISAEQPRLQKMLLKQTKDSASDKTGATAKQAESETLSADAYNSTMQSLDKLIESGTQARGEVEAFRRNLMWPFTWSAAFEGPRPDADDPDVQKMLDEDFCYGEHAEIIRDTLADFDKMIGELKASKVASASLKGLSNSHQGNLNGGLTPAAPAGQVKGIAPNAPKYDGDPARGQSDISGVKEEAERKAGKK